MSDSVSTARGQVGIGTLIIFIALLLVAAIAAGAVINISQLLESQSAATSEDVQQKVNGRLSVVAMTGNVTTAGGTTGIDRVRIIVTLGANNMRVDLRDLLIVWSGPEGGFELTPADDFDRVSALSGETFAYQVETDADNSAPVINSANDRVTLVIDAETFGETGLLTAGEEVTVRLVAGSGSETVVRIVIPNGLDGQSAVAL